MGHERIGVLPRSIKWRTVVDDLAKFSHRNVNVESLSYTTLQNVRSRLTNIANDEGVNAAFSFLLILSYSAKTDKPAQALTDDRIKFALSSSQLEIARQINKWVEDHIESREYGELGKAAAIDAIAAWADKLKTGQENLFGKANSNEEIWKKSGNGSGFCELARLFFSKYTERYLNYFLEREASAHMSSWEDRERLKDELQEHIQKVSRYAFETAKITESFAAGWYNKHTKESIPSKKDIRGFLWLAFEKLREELRRESVLQ